MLVEPPRENNNESDMYDITRDCNVSNILKISLLYPTLFGNDGSWAVRSLQVLSNLLVATYKIQFMVY